MPRIDIDSLPVEGLQFAICVAAPATAEQAKFYRSLSTNYDYSGVVEINSLDTQVRRNFGKSFIHLEDTPFPLCRQNTSFFIPDYRVLEQIQLVLPYSPEEKDVLIRLVGQINHDVIQEKLSSDLSKGQLIKYSDALTLPARIYNHAGRATGKIRVFKPGPWLRWKTRPQD